MVHESCLASTGSADAVPPPQFAGVWAGEYRITATTGVGHRAGTLVPFTLRLERTGVVLRGNFQTDSVLIDVSGLMDDNGIMSLEGSAPGLGPVDFVGAATLTRFRARVDNTGGLTGDWSTGSIARQKRDRGLRRCTRATSPLLNARRDADGIV
jgi:hypothetical protein